MPSWHATLSLSRHVAACLATMKMNKAAIWTRPWEVMIGCLNLPNRNPAPGQKFDYKLHWFERLKSHCADRLARETSVAIIDDFNAMPTEIDVYKPERWRDYAWADVRRAFHELQG